jgi:hypothetical protein
MDGHICFQIISCGSRNKYKITITDTCRIWHEHKAGTENGRGCRNQETPWVMWKNSKKKTKIVLSPKMKSNMMIYHNYFVFKKDDALGLGID